MTYVTGPALGSLLLASFLCLKQPNAATNHDLQEVRRRRRKRNLSISQ